MNIFRRYWNWCRRFRHRCGYGVHSPTDFFLITSVIYEQLPYYAYDVLKKENFSRSLPHYRRKVNRLLFRLVNYFLPDILIEVGTGNGEAIGYMRAARSSMQSISFEGNDKENTLQEFKKKMEATERVDFLHIAYTPYYQEVFELALPFVNERTCFVIGNPYACKDKEEWWKQVLKDERVFLTFDLFDIGLVFFNRKRCKQNHIVNFL